MPTVGSPASSLHHLANRTILAGVPIANSRARLARQIPQPNLEELIDQFLLYLATERGLSTNYQLSTQRSLEAFAKWLSWLRLNLRRSTISSPAISPTTWPGGTRRACGGLDQARSHRAEGLLSIPARTKNPFEQPGREPFLPRIEKYLPETLDTSSDQAFAGKCQRGRFAWSSRPSDLELLYASGLRISELCNIRLENLDLEEGVIRVTGKGNKTRLVPVGSAARRRTGALP